MTRFKQKFEDKRSRFWCYVWKHYPKLYKWCYKHLPFDTYPF